MKLFDAWSEGYFALQHQKYDEKKFALDMRAHLRAARVTDRLVGVGEVGTWVADPDSPGDIHGGQLWKKASREISMWRFATPVVISGRGGGGGPSGGAMGGMIGANFGVPNLVGGQGSPNAGANFGVPNLAGGQGSPNTGADFGVPNLAGGQGAPNAGGNFSDPTPGSAAPAPGPINIGIDNPEWGPSAPGQSPGTTPPGDPVATGAPPSTGKCGVAPANFTMLPIYNESFMGDDRVEALQGKVPDRKKTAWPKPVANAVGISLTANVERDQVDLFFPTDPRIIAPNYAGDKDMGTPVCDLNEKFEVDPERAQGIQSMMRVVKKPLGGKNVIAWQLGDTGCGDTKGGHVIDKPTAGGSSPSPTATKTPTIGDPVASGGRAAQQGFQVLNSPSSPAPRDPSQGFNLGDQGGAAPKGGIGPGQTVAESPGTLSPKVVALASRNDGGPFDVGSGKCRHVKGRDADGFPVSRLHFDINSLFRRNDDEDGELNVTTWEPGDVQNKKVRVQFGWNPQAQKWDWWTTGFVYYPSPPPPPPPDHPDPGRPTKVPDPQQRPTTPGRTMTPDVSQPPPRRVSLPTAGGVTVSPGLGGRPGETTGAPSKVQTGSGGGGGGAPVEKEPDFDTPEYWEKLRGGVFPPSRPPSSGKTMGAASFQGPATDYGYTMTDQAMGLGEILAKPYNYTGGQADFRYDPQPQATMSAKRAQEFPVTSNVAAFGAQGGAGQTLTPVPPAPTPSPVSPPTPSPPSPSPSPVSIPPIPPTPSTPSAVSTTPFNYGATGDPWNYTQRPGRGRYRGGTANGGFVVLPPEVGLEMADDGLEPKEGVTVSETYWGVGPGAKFFAGIPDLVTGRPLDGFSWGSDSSSDLVFGAHYGASQSMPAIKFSLANQNIAFTARTGFYGTLTHYSSAARTWAFPDISGDVVCFDAYRTDPETGTVATLGGIGASGPSVATQAGWARTYLNGAQVWIPFWF